jgi:hypothetical protein
MVFLIKKNDFIDQRIEIWQHILNTAPIVRDFMTEVTDFDMETVNFCNFSTTEIYTVLSWSDVPWKREKDNSYLLMKISTPPCYNA